MPIRLATPEDLPQILAIYAPYITDTTHTLEYTVPSLAEFTARFQDITGQFPWLVWEEDGKILVITRNEKKSLAVIIEKKLNEDGYFETYSITNNSHTEFFLTKENFGIPMPYDCLYDPGRDIMNDCCLTHLWCGGDCAHHRRGSRTSH